MSRPRLAVYRHLVLPPSETFVKNQIDALREFDVTLFGIDREPSLVPDVPTFLLEEHGNRLVARLRVRAFQLLRRSPTLRRTIAASRPDLLVTHFAQDAWRIVPTASAVGVPLVVVCHGSDVLEDDAAAAKGGLSMRQLVGHWGDLADASVLFVASSQFLADALVGRGVPADKVVVHHLGIPIPPLATDAARADLLFVGRLVESKNAAAAVRAHARLLADRPGLGLTVVGAGPERERLEALTGELGTSELVRFEGACPPERVGELMASHAALAVPSIKVASGGSEGFGLVGLEAAARGLPAVVYDTGGLREAVGDDREGGALLVPTGDEDALVNALGAILDDPALAAELGARGRTRAVEQFDLHTCTQRFEQTLLAVAQGVTR